MTGQEELLMLRALVEKQKEELAAKDEIIAKQNIRIQNMVQALLQARKKLFGPSTETSKKLDGQLSLFESTEALAKELFSEQQKITVPSHTRKARQPGVRQEMLAGLPKEIEEYIIPDDEVCSKCGEDLMIIGKRIVRTEVTYEPAKLKVKQIVQQIAKCTQCGKEGSENPKDHFQKAAIPVPVLSHSIATPSLVAQVMYQKFAMGMPFARQEKDWYRLGLILSRSNMANWTNRCSEEWLTPVYERIHAELLSCEVLHMDETRIQCNREDGKKASSDSYMWVIRSGACEHIQAVLFHYSPSRKREIARQLLSGFRGYLTTDAYSAYEKVENIRRNLCWSHCRRYYIDSIPLTSNGKEIPGSKGAEGRAFILHQPEVLEKYLPWSQELPEVCRLNHNYKKCLK